MKTKINKEAQSGNLLRVVLWIVFFIIALSAFYFLYKRMIG